MHDRPPFALTDCTIMSRYFSHWSAASSPRITFENPGPCNSTRGSCLYIFVVDASPNSIDRSTLRSNSPAPP
jgi:hypothetical protein